MMLVITGPYTNQIYLHTKTYDNPKNRSMGIRNKCYHRIVVRKGFEQEMWFDLGNFLWKNNFRVYGNHARYTHNNITKNFVMFMMKYAKIMCDMLKITLYPPPTSKKGKKWDDTERAKKFHSLHERVNKEVYHR